MSHGLIERVRTYPVLVGPPEAIVLYCSDPRFTVAHREFAEQELELPAGKYVAIKVAGGAGVMCRRSQSLHREEGRHDLEFVRDRFMLHCAHFPQLRRLIFISHADCGYYKRLSEVLKKLHQTTFDPTKWARKDLGAIPDAVSGLIPMLEAFADGKEAPFSIECYFARFANLSKTEISFERLY